MNSRQAVAANARRRTGQVRMSVRLTSAGKATLKYPGCKVARVGSWFLCALLALLSLGIGSNAREKPPTTSKGLPIAIIVMDPLAKELACACVVGYAQRDYHKLATYLSKELGQPTIVSFSDNLTDSISKLVPVQEVVVIAKQSIVEHDAEGAQFKNHALCRLTGQDGSTTLTGLFVAKAGDSAGKLEHLDGRRFIFGSANADEKHAAAIAASKAAGVRPPAKLETREACSDAAIDVLDSTEQPPPIGVISSYALPLLEGCGSIKKGDLKIVGRTEPVPFITVFVGDAMPADKQRKLQEVLLAARKKSSLRKALETKDGFVPMLVNRPPAGSSPAVAEWPGWRGPNRDGHVPKLPARLPGSARLLWKKPAMNGGLAGLAVAQGCVLVADRDPADERDVFRCLDADTGELRWLVDYRAAGKLDYGQFPRATPLIHDGRAYLLGAFGDLRCVNLASGKVLWKRNFIRDLGGQLPKWGTCSSPLILDDWLIVNPGGPRASLVALDARTGRTRWKSAGSPAAYASFITARLGERLQIVGYDQSSLGGWNPKTGERLWKVVPPVEGDFNVPTPLVVEDKLLVATENNGTRLYGFDPDGRIIPDPLAAYADLSPDTATPISANGRVFGCRLGLHCLDWRDNLKCLWRAEDKAFDEFVSLIADRDSVLAVTLSGECLLLSANGNRCEIRSRLRLFEEDAEIFSHPALVGNRLYVRGLESVCCFDLAAD